MRRRSTADDVVVDARGVVVRYDEVIAVREVDLALRARCVVALMGRNGSGKSSLLWALQGAGTRQAGTVEVEGRDSSSASPMARLSAARIDGREARRTRSGVTSIDSSNARP